ncbi:MAG: hypothetical protein ABTS16_01110 [Candidatus Accumulibacter phosphatis]|uniref:hypothetical protein n=1 Tax=Candidatus Accumulibacter contiguus TaxID=2954381 RepID=UPI0027E24F61|nr:hypothetical protein [Candidatus Accumulibacter contiguus]
MQGQAPNLSLKLSADKYRAIRRAIANIPGDVSNDAVGANVAKLEDIYAPETHSSALDPGTPIILGARGSGKSFWSSVLGRADTKAAAARAYPRLGLVQVEVQFGYTGIGGPGGVSVDQIDRAVPPDASSEQARSFWWATILSAATRQSGQGDTKPKDFLDSARDWERREDLLDGHEQRLRGENKTLLIVYDALDTVARTWKRRRLLTEALLEVVWAMRAYRSLRVKLFLRPDQIEDDALRFVEIPKLRNGAVNLQWSGSDLYGLLFARLALTPDEEARSAFGRLLGENGFTLPDSNAVLTRRWSLGVVQHDQKLIMDGVAGRFMGQGMYAFKKGSTYQWPITHLADAFDEVTPRSFLGMMIAAAKYGPAPEDKVITPDGIRHGLREASKTRVDQLHQEFPWIKGVLAPLAGLLLPQSEEGVFDVWRRATTVDRLKQDAQTHDYMPPFPDEEQGKERDLCVAMERIGVMFRRKDDRVDMPDLFRVAARLLKKGAIAPR